MPTLHADPGALQGAAHHIRRLADATTSGLTAPVDGLDPAAAEGTRVLSAALTDAAHVLAAGIDALARDLEAAARAYAATEQAVGRVMRR